MRSSIRKKIDANDPVFEKQEVLLKSISREQHADLISLFKKIRTDDVKQSRAFQLFHKKLYDLGIVYDFKWMRWYEGIALLKNSQTDYSKLSLLQISMLITCIFRSDRFDEISIKQYFENGTIEELMNRMKKLKSCYLTLLQSL